MRGRYYLNTKTAGEIEKIVRQIDADLKANQQDCTLQLSAKDIHPTELAPVITADRGGMHFVWQHWGLRGFSDKKIIFNARSETAAEKPLFQEGVLHHRIVIPATWFYEWNMNS